MMSTGTVRPRSRRTFRSLSPSLPGDRKSTRLNSSHGYISYAVFCLKKKKNAFLDGHCARPQHLLVEFPDRGLGHLVDEPDLVVQPPFVDLVPQEGDHLLLGDLCLDH